MKTSNRMRRQSTASGASTVAPAPPKARRRSNRSASIIAPDDAPVSPRGIRFVEKCDAVTMTVESEFPGRHGGGASTLLSKNKDGAGGRGGSKFIEQLLGKPSPVAQQHQAAAAATSSSVTSVGSPPATPVDADEQQQQQQKESSASSSVIAPTPPLSSLLASQQQQQSRRRMMMRPSTFADQSLFPKMRVAGLNGSSGSDSDEEERDLEGRTKKQQQQGGDEDSSKSPSKSRGAADHHQQSSRSHKGGSPEKEDTLIDDVEQNLARTVRLKKVTTLPDEVLQLVRKLRSAADIIGSSEGSPPPDALREVAVHSAALARFVSSWTLQQIAEKEQTEASTMRGWLSDAARELKAKADNLSWATTHNAPDAASASGGKSCWPKSFAAISANLGPWIMSTLYLIMDSLLHAVQCDRGAIFVPDDSGRVVSACLVGAGGIARPIRVPRGHGVVGEVFRSGVAVNVLSTEARGQSAKRSDEIFTRDVDNTTGFYTRNLIAVPVFAVGHDLVVEASQKREEQQRKQQQQQQRGGAGAPANAATVEKPAAKAPHDNAAIVGRAPVVAVIELINKLVPANGEFTPADEMLVAQVGSVVASMIAACGGVLQLGTETALNHSAELQAKLLAMRPAAIKARRQFLTATVGGCDAEETGRFSFTQVLNLHEEQKARERNIALQLNDQTSATDLSRCGASNERIQDIFRIGGASTKVLRIGGDGGKNTEVERTLQDMASFVGRIEAAWASTRERCVIAESEATAGRMAYTRLEHEMQELRKLAQQCGILKEAPGGDGANAKSRRQSVEEAMLRHQQQQRAGSVLSGKGSDAIVPDVDDDDFGLLDSSGNKKKTTTEDASDVRLRDNSRANSPEGGGRSSRGSHRGSAHGGGGGRHTSADDHAILERLLHSGDPSDSWDSARGAFLDYFQSKTSGYKRLAAVDVVQQRNLNIMRDRAAVSTVGATLRTLEHQELADRLMRAGDLKSVADSAASTRHRDRGQHRHTIKEKAEVDPLSVACGRLQGMVSRHEQELAALVERQQAETRELYEELLSSSGGKEPERNSMSGAPTGMIGGQQGFRLVVQEFLKQSEARLRGKRG